MKASHPGLLALVALSLVGGKVLVPSLEAQKQAALGPSAPSTPPPDVAVPGVLLGAFRGLVVDYLWLRACRLQEDGKFYEAKDLAEWISKLEPRLEQVWSFQAHELAWNLCAATDDRNERWRWIEEGITLLRDKGIPLNPHAPELYFTLSRIYSDKIGGPFDDHHLFFKKQLAIELVRAFGPLVKDPLGRDPDPDLEGLAQAPELDAEATVLLAQLEKTGLDLNVTDPTGTRIGWDEALSKAPAARAILKEAPPEVEARLRRHFRAKALKALHLDARKCLEIERRYGPLDWHGCDAISLYWAVEGVNAAGTLGPGRAAREHRRLERLAINSVKHAARRGRLILEPGDNVFFAPEPRLVGRVLALYDDAIERAAAAEKAGDVALPDEEEDDDEHHHEKPKEDTTSALNYRLSMESARLDFLPEAIMILADYGQEADSRKLYQKLVATRPTGRNYDEFVGWLLREQATTELGDQASTQQILLGLWTRAWIAIARGDDERAKGQIALAIQVYHERQRLVAKYRAEGDQHPEIRIGAINPAKAKAQGYEDALKRIPAYLKRRLEDRGIQKRLEDQVPPELQGGN
jgi:hypothetical protein